MRERVSTGVVENRYTVRSGAVSSRGKPGVTYVDYRMPHKFWEFLAVHEQCERSHMLKGMPYSHAHEAATTTEHMAVEERGTAFDHSWKKYTEEIDGELSHIEREKGKCPSPPDPHIDPGKAVEAGHHRDKHKHTL
jgi:hypothetical protein